MLDLLSWTTIHLSLAHLVSISEFLLLQAWYHSNPKLYDQLIERRDADALMELLTRKDVEEKILVRVREKVHHIQSVVNGDIRSVVDPEIVLSFYRDSVIPLTKKGEVLYLLHRKGREP